jgi:hypothetical protein
MDTGVVVGRGYVRALLDLGLGHRERLEDLAVDQEADQRSKGGRAVGLLGEADGDAYAEEHREAAGDGAARLVEDRGDLVPAEAVGPEDVRLPEPDYQTRRRQHGDRELQTAADLLQALEQTGTPLLRGGRRCRGGGAHTSSIGWWSTPLSGVDHVVAR